MKLISIITRGIISFGLPLFLTLLTNGSFDNILLFLGFLGSYETLKISLASLFPTQKSSIGVNSFSNVQYFIRCIPHWYTSYVMGFEIEKQNPEKLFWTCFIFVIGMSVIAIAETQKYVYYTVKNSITVSGIFSKCRNPEFLGDSIVNFTLLTFVNSVWACSLFILLEIIIIHQIIVKKEKIMEKDEMWKKYKKETWMIFPKIVRNFYYNLIIYIMFLLIGALIYIKGGLRKLVLQKL